MKYLFTVALFTFFFATQSDAQIRIGAGPVAAYGSEIFTGINVSATYIGEGAFDFGAGYTYWLTDQSHMAVDLDAYYLMKIIGYDDDIYISPFAGLNVARSTLFSDGNGTAMGYSLNLGLSVKKEIGDRMIFIEPKVMTKLPQLQGGYPDVVVKAGLLF